MAHLNIDDKLIAITDPVGNTTRYSYDADNRLVTTTDATAHTVTNTYDDAGRLATRTDRLGRVQTYGYDNANRLTSDVWRVSGTTVDTLSYTYYGDGSVHTAGDNAGQYTFAYDSDGRVSTQADTYHGITLTSGYSAAGDRTSLADTAGGTVASTYDADHQLLTRGLSGTGITGVRVEYSYNTDGETSQQRRYNAAVGGTLVGTTDYGYDYSGRLTSEIHKNGAGTALVTYVNAYDTDSRIATETRNGTARTFTYDATSQVKADSGTGASYGYDLNGNRTSGGSSTGSDNRLSTDGSNRRPSRS